MRKVVLFFAGCIILIGCEKKITIKQGPYTSKPSIQCLLEPDSFPRLFLNVTQPFLTANVNTGNMVIRNASVKISSNFGVDLLALDSIYDRIYCRYNYFYTGTKKIQKNTTYTLEITANGETYIATTTTDNIACSIDSIGYTTSFKDLYGEHEGVIVYFKDVPNVLNYYRFEMLRQVDSTMRHAKIQLSGSCLANDTVFLTEYGRSVYSDINLNGQQLKLVIEPAYSHRAGTKSYVLVQSIDKATYDFFDQLDKQKLAQNNPFVEPVFIKDGQFGKKAIGFFGSVIHSAPVYFEFPE